MIWIVILVLIVLIGYLLDREVYFYEGAHLGPRVQSWLYDRWARQYDAGKRESQLQDDEMLAQPLLEHVQDVPEPLILDFATGTGRLSYALLNRPEFNGHIIALDLSQGMLEQAASKIKPLIEQKNSSPQGPGESAASIEFIRQRSLPLPFPDAAFDAVACLEVLELLPDARSALEEVARVLRPGGVLLTSRGTEESGRRAKVKSAAEMADLLQACGLEEIQITRWWRLFDRVFARKSGTSIPAGVHALTDLLQCSRCRRTAWAITPDGLICTGCGHGLHSTGSGILLNEIH